MGELQEKMLRRMELKNFSNRTIEIYLYQLKKYVSYYNCSPEKLGKEDIESYLHFLLQQKASSSTMAQAYSALKYFYSDCLERPWELDKIPRPKREKRLPIILSRSEIKNLLGKVSSPKNKIILMVIYSGGLRLTEALHLRIKDIDSQRMEIRVEQGKGKKDRYTLLSNFMLKKLRDYYNEYQPVYWLFPGKLNKPLSSTTIQKVFNKAKKKPGLKKTLLLTPYGTVLLLIY